MFVFGSVSSVKMVFGCRTGMEQRMQMVKDMGSHHRIHVVTLEGLYLLLDSVFVSGLYTKQEFLLQLKRSIAE